MKVRFDYRVQGMTYYYHGEDKEVFFMPEEDEDVFEAAKRAAMQKVCRDGQFSPICVKIENVRIVQ
jgi:hypothetical protein